MNLNENIQRLRRQAGLSQEALAEKLGVSRQAVSKWESGAALPELEKLADLAQLFSVRLDELVGLPAPNAPEKTDPSSGADSVEKISAAYEQTLHHLLTSVNAQTAAHYKKLLGAVGVLAAGALVAVSLMFSSQLRTLRLDTNNRIAQLNSSISELYGQIHTPQTPASNEVLSYECLIGALDPLQNRMTLDLSATPREYREGTAARFVLRSDDFEPLSVDAARGADGAYTAAAELPISNQVEISLVLMQDGVERTEPLETLYGFADMSRLEVSAFCNGGYSRFNSENTVRFHVTPTATLYSYDTEWLQKSNLPPLAPESGRAELTQNGKVIQSVPLTFSPADEHAGTGSSDAGSSAPVRYGSEGFSAEGEAIERTCGFVPGDCFALALYLTDSYGQQYEELIFSFSIAEDGSFTDAARPVANTVSKRRDTPPLLRKTKGQDALLSPFANY